MIRLWPECETSRMIDRWIWLAAACLFGGSVAAGIAQAQPQPQEARTRFPVTSANVVAAMQRAQLPTQDVHVKMAMPITALSADPQLEIQSTALVGTHEIRLRMSCRDRSECLPFFVTATYASAVDASVLPAKQEHAAAAASVGETLSPRPNMAIADAAETKRSEAPDGAQILKVGSAATLDIDGDRIHIRMDVICLANGAAGDKIRVTTRDHKQFYVAQIVTPTLLKGSL